MTVVPYKGTAESFAAMVGGHITASSGGAHQNQDHIKTGKVQILVLYGEERMKVFPDIPAVKDLGYHMNAEGYFYIVASKGTPQPVMRRVEEVFHKGMVNPKFRETMPKIEMEVAYKYSEETKEYFESEYHSIGKLANELKLAKEKDVPEKR